MAGLDDHVEIYGANVSGTTWGYDNYNAALAAFRKLYDRSRVNEDKHCIACWSGAKHYEPGMDVGYHTFLVREDMMCQILQDCDFEFTKKKGMGRAVPRDWINEQVSQGNELWFTLKFFPNYD